MPFGIIIALNMPFVKIFCHEFSALRRKTAVELLDEMGKWKDYRELQMSIIGGGMAN